jgi:hypothetical protein
MIPRSAGPIHGSSRPGEWNSTRMLATATGTGVGNGGS